MVHATLGLHARESAAAGGGAGGGRGRPKGGKGELVGTTGRGRLVERRVLPGPDAARRERMRPNVPRAAASPQKVPGDASDPLL